MAQKPEIADLKPEILRFEPFTWPNEIPAGCPFGQSKAFNAIRFLGVKSGYHYGDTWYPTWADNDILYSPWTDGKTKRLDGYTDWSQSWVHPEHITTGQGVILGDDPLNLMAYSIGLDKSSPAAPYPGRYPCGSLFHNGIWYYGTYCLGPGDGVYYGKTRLNWPWIGPFVGFRYSRDYGHSWTPPPQTPSKPLFGESGMWGYPIKIGAPHFVDFGKNMEHSPDGKAYLVAHGADESTTTKNWRMWNDSWVTGDQVYLLRVTPDIKTINDPAAYEFYAGKDKDGKPIWTSDFGKIKPLLEWDNNMGCVTVTYNPGLKKYLMCVTDGGNTILRMNTYLLEADRLDGDWKIITYMKEFGTQAYFVNIPSKFISPDGTTMWLLYSANFSLDENQQEHPVNPPGSHYGMTFQKIELLKTDRDKIGLKEHPVPVSSVKNITGFYGQRMEVNRNGYLKNFPIDQYVDFIVNRQHTAWDWTQAEQHGKWIESAWLSAIQAGDTALMAKVQSVLNRIIGSQEPSGYLGATAASYRSAERPIRGMDPYELYFVFHALITVYEQSGNEKALEAVEKLAGYFLANFGPGKQEFWPSDLRYPGNRYKKLAGTSRFAGHSVHYSWEGTLLCDPMARLYSLTGEKKYLDWSQWVVSNIDRWSGWDSFSRLDSVADGTLGVDQLQPYVHSHTFHMNFMGFLRLYRITGDASLLRKVQGAWEDIRNRQMYITGGVSVAEHYEHGYVKPLSGNIVETCATMSWMQLTQMLLEITGDVKYADAIEKLLINHVFAAQAIDEGICRYHTAPNGTKPDGFFHGPDCCTASGHRIISLLPAFAYAEKGADFFINQYMPSEYRGSDLSFKVKTSYPESEKIDIAITSGAPVEKSINLRIPAWCKAPQVSVNGARMQDIRPGSYLKITRKWKPGDKVTITLPMEEHWVKREHHSDYSMSLLPGGEQMYREIPTNRVPVAFVRGPVVYSLDMVWNGGLGNDSLDLNRDISVNPTLLPVVTAKPDEQLLGPVYETVASYKGKAVKMLLTPFANTGYWFRPGATKPELNAKAFTYGIWLYDNEYKIN